MIRLTEDREEHPDQNPGGEQQHLAGEPFKRPSPRAHQTSRDSQLHDGELGPSWDRLPIHREKENDPGQGQHRPEDQQQLRQPSLPSASRVQNIQCCLPAGPVDMPAGEQRLHPLARGGGLLQNRLILACVHRFHALKEEDNITAPVKTVH